MMTGLIQRTLVGTYALVNRTGILRIPLYRKGFRLFYFLYKRYLEDPLVTLLQAQPTLCSGGLVMDVGANLGYTSQLFSRYLDAGGGVVAFEPDRNNFDVLSAVARRHPAVLPVWAAVGSQEGTVSFWSNPAHHGDSRTVTDTFGKTWPAANRLTYTVPLVSIDGYLAKERPGEPVALIKIDVQGYEEQVLRGSAGTIERNPAVTIVMEYSPDSARELGFDPTRQLHFLQERGFHLYFLRRGKALREFDYGMLRQELAGRGYCDLVATRDPLRLSR
ncbi:MAG: hypothetical protein RLY31_646 [Bacteroidota bacterium]|jgi:FkbM family methyltransferase